MPKNKVQLGQFFTTNTAFILDGFEKYVRSKYVTDPFAGNQDLLNWAKAAGAASVAGFDIDPAYVDHKTVFQNDSLRYPKRYEFVVTNPPYLYQNKLKKKDLLKNSEHSDLYQLALEKIMDSTEGIIIVPVNFLSAQNARFIRRLFFEKFQIREAAYFTEQAFADTTYNVIAFYYCKTTNPEEFDFPLRLIPQNKTLCMTLSKAFDYQIGGAFLSAVRQTKNNLKIGRLEQTDLEPGACPLQIAVNHLHSRRTVFVSEQTAALLQRNIIILKAIDTGTETGKICLEDRRKYNIDALVSLHTSRNQIELLFPPHVTLAEQERLIGLFNAELSAAREKYFSLFMTNFRDHNRKRISFQFAYLLLNALYFSKIKRYAE